MTYNNSKAKAKGHHLKTIGPVGCASVHVYFLETESQAPL